MSGSATNSPISFLRRVRSLAVPLLAAMLIFVVLQPLPPGFMDMLLVLNLAIAAVVLLTAFFVASPLDFSVFPSLLLGTTLLRLGLNVATTRLILTAGADGRDLEQARHAAGEVILAFSRFVTGDSLEVGIILFIVLSIIQFAVITKGASRISEVAARFVLDAMPGRQMAIDSDLAAGALDASQAQQARAELQQQADFYGAMDGASKFLRGDAVAAVLITLVNVLGGLYVGLARYGWDLSQTAELFTRLSIGDGLVAQLPAFLISISAALIVTRSAGRANFGDDIARQLTAQPGAMALAGVLLAMLALTDLPRLPLIIAGGGCIGLAWLVSRQRRLAAESADDEEPAVKGQDPRELLATDPIRLDLGFALLRLLDKDRGGDLLERVAQLRRQLASELGLVVPQVTFADKMRLESHTYEIRLRGLLVGTGRLYPRQVLALTADGGTDGLEGRRGVEPIFNTPGVWINQPQTGTAQSLGYTVIEPGAVLTAHLADVIRSRGSELLTRQATSDMLAAVAGRAPALAAEVKDRFSVAQVQRVLQELLRERVSVRELETILEAMCEAGERTSDFQRIVESVRGAMGRHITAQYRSSDGKLWCLQIEPKLQQALSADAAAPVEQRVTARPQEARRLAEEIGRNLAQLREQGKKPVLVCSPQARRVIRQLIEPVAPDAAVLAYSEIDSADIHAVGEVRVEQ
jgi:flagellar biosynthesis protein FlhA